MRQSGTESWLDTEKPVQGYKQEGQHHPNGGAACMEVRKQSKVVQEMHNLKWAFRGGVKTECKALM